MDVEGYLKAGTRDNTRRSYQSAVEHFEVNWGGLLPATSDSVARYLAHYASSLSANTLKQRLAALAQWHITQGFPDPTKAPLVKQVLKGIRATHVASVRQAKPLALQHLEQAVSCLTHALETAVTPVDRLKNARDLALLLIGFWRGFRSDELCRLQVEHVHIVGQGMGLRIFLPQSKSDRQNQGQYYSVPALNQLCPVQAYQSWLHHSGLIKGPVFQSINRWGQLSGVALHAGSLIGVFRQAFQRSGISAENYSTHSLRRGFATWATAQGWDIKTLMTYVGWKDLKSALRYVDTPHHFGALAKMPPNLELQQTAHGLIPSKLNEV